MGSVGEVSADDRTGGRRGTWCAGPTTWGGKRDSGSERHQIKPEAQTQGPQLVCQKSQNILLWLVSVLTKPTTKRGSHRTSDRTSVDEASMPVVEV